MTRTRRGPAPDRTGPHEAPAKKPQRQRTAADPQVTAGELIRRLARGVVDADGPADATARLRDAAGLVAELVTGRHVDRIAAATALSLAAQTAGVGQSTAFTILDAAFHRRAGR
jgi:hypothetical protein